MVKESAEKPGLERNGRQGCLFLSLLGLDWKFYQRKNHWHSAETQQYVHRNSSRHPFDYMQTPVIFQFPSSIQILDQTEINKQEK